MANDEFEDYVVDEPKRTRRGALKYQPPDADWGLDRLTEVKDYFQSAHKRPLPLANMGQGSVHNRLGYDHRNSADVSLAPSSTEGQALITELQRRKIPFIAFDRAIPGASTGAHIHVGRPSSRTSTKYAVGSQVKRTKQQQPADDFDSYIVAEDGDTDDFDKYVTTSQQPAKPAPARPTAPATPSWKRPFGTTLPTDAVRAGVLAHERPAIEAAVNAFDRQRTQSSGLGELRRIDETVMDQRRAVESQVRAERGARRGRAAGQVVAVANPLSLNPLDVIPAVRELVRGDEEAAVRTETDRRMQASFEEQERLREIASQFTDSDRAQLTAAIQRMRGQGSISRGVEVGSQRVGSSLLYKLAAVADVMAGPSKLAGGTPWLGNYLRRQAGRGEIAINEIESELPPDQRQQLADFITHSVAALPEVFGAVAVGGPIGGFAALGGLEAAGRKQSFAEIAKETAKGAVIGGVFGAAGGVESGPARTLAQRAARTAESSAAIGTGTYLTEKAFGATDADAARAAATNILFHVGMRVPGEISRFAAAAERALKTPETPGGEPTVGPELQERLSRAETTPPPPAPLTDPAQAGKPPQPTTPAEPAVAATAAGPARPGDSFSVLDSAKTGDRVVVDGVEGEVIAEGAVFGSSDRRLEVRLVNGNIENVTSNAIRSGMQLSLPERRGPERIRDADWLALTPEERALIRGELAAETEPLPAAPEPVAGQAELPFGEPAKRSLAELMGQRAEGGPAEPVLPYEITGSGRNWTARIETPSGTVVTEGFKSRVEAEQYARDYGRAGQRTGEEGFLNLRALFGRKGKQETPEERARNLREQLDREDAEIRAKFQAEIAAEPGTEPFLRPPRTIEEAGQRYSTLVSRMLYLNNHIGDAQRLGLSKAEVDKLWQQHSTTLQKAQAVERYIADKGYKVSPIGEVVKAEESFTGKVPRPGKGEGGFVDLNEIREGLRAGKLKIEEAISRLGQLYLDEPGVRTFAAQQPDVYKDRLKAALNRNQDPYIGVVSQGEVHALPDPLRIKHHRFDFGWLSARNNERWRYEPGSKTVYWDESPTAEAKNTVENYLDRLGMEVTAHSDLIQHGKDRTALMNEEAKSPVHHSTSQPRTDTGQFSPGEPGGTEAARSQLRAEARKYAEQFKRLDRHQARREGLDIVNDDVARNYFAQLHRLASEHLPARAEAVDRAETLYNQGKYGQAQMLAESVFRSLPDKVNEYAGADAAIQLLDRGLTPQANWSKVLQEVRERIKRTGPLSGGGSTFYDVNKYPEGGRPDHAKIAYILEPVVEALKADAARLFAEGKLRAEDYVNHIRTQVNKMLQSPEFADWHPLNRAAALGVLVDRLRKDGPPPPGGPPTTVAEPPAPRERQRSLPKTLEKSGRDPGTDTTYTQLPNKPVNDRVEARLANEGAEALESWFRTAPESADRTAAHRILVDHYTAEAVKLADTAPQRAQELMQHARDLTNLEDARATTLGQAVQMYSNLLKYTPAGVLRELSSLEKKGVKVPEKAATELVQAAHEHKRLDKEVRRLEKKVAELEVAEGEVEAPQAATRRRGPRKADEPTEPAEETPTRPRRYRPRGDTISISGAERARVQLDEAAKRRRAQKAFIAQQLRALEQQRTVAGYWKRSMNITRGLMVSALSTAMRNLQSQAVRFDIERLDDLVEHSIRRTVGLDSDLTARNIWRNTARQFRVSQTGEAREILKAHDAEYWRMFNTYAGGVEAPIPTRARAGVERIFGTVERGVEIVNFFNRIQEFHLRSAEFLAELDLHLRKDHNQTLEQFVNRNGIDAIPLDLVRKAVDKALEVTFADMPAKDGAGGRTLTSLIEFGNYLPPTMSPVAFPRFMYNNIKFLYQHSPAGMLDLARRGQNRPRVIARSLVATSLLLLAYQFRQSDHAGEKWYELRVGDTTLDTRPFNPFSTYLFIAEAIRRQKEGEKQFTEDEIAQTLGASVLGEGAGTDLIKRIYQQVTAGEWEKLQRTLKAEAGEWGRALLTPVRQVKDLIAAFDASQAVTRDTSTEPFLGPIRESIPFASTDLPEARRPTTATPIRQERPATKALTGWRTITPKTFLERELDRMGFDSREIRTNTGVPEIDALEKRLMGPLMDQLSQQLEADDAYKAMTPKARANYLREVMEDVREDVRAMGEEERPELYEKLREDRKPRRQREFEQEQLNSPGLSSALRLGVPMSIPPMNPGEDDIAYRARLLQLGRARRAKLDNAVDFNLSDASLRRRLYESVYS